MSENLTVRDAVRLGSICDAAISNKYVARLIDGIGVVEGTARSIGDDRGYFAGDNDDVRDCFLRVTTSSGFEAFWPVSELIGEVASGYFVLDYQR